MAKNNYLTTGFCKTCKYRGTNSYLDNSNFVRGCDFLHLTGISRHSLRAEFGDAVFQYGEDCILYEEGKREKALAFGGQY